MGTYRTSVFPALDNKSSMDIVSREVAYYFIHLFPVDFFKYIYVDTLVGSPNMYITKNGVLEMVREEVQQVEYPRLFIKVRPKANNVDETQFEKMISIYKYPIAQAVQSDNTMAFTFFDGDPYHIQISSMDDYSKSEIDFQIVVRSKNDQQAVANILDTCVKKHYGYPFLVKTEYILPVSLTDHIRHCIYRKELSILEKNSEFMTREERDSVLNEINERFKYYINKYSFGDIVPDSDQNGVYKLKRGLRVYLKIEPWDKDEGNKKDNVYENFSLTASGYYECYHPSSFTTRIPTIVRGTSNSKLVITSGERNTEGKVHTVLSREAYSEEREINIEKLKLDKYWIRIYDEREVIFENSELEQIELLDWIDDKFINMVLRLLNENSTIEELQENLKIFVYEDRKVIDPDRVYLSEGMVLNITNNNPDKLYYIEIFINSQFMNRRLLSLKAKGGL